MTDNLRDLFPEDLSDEAAWHIGNFLYELAQVFESIHLGQIRRYSKSRTDLHNEMVEQNNQGMNAETDRPGPAF